MILSDKPETQHVVVLQSSSGRIMAAYVVDNLPALRQVYTGDNVIQNGSLFFKAVGFIPSRGYKTARLYKEVTPVDLGEITTGVEDVTSIFKE